MKLNPHNNSYKLLRKMEKVVFSCKTKEQFENASKYISNFSKLYFFPQSVYFNIRYGMLLEIIYSKTKDQEIIDQLCDNILLEDLSRVLHIRVDDFKQK